MEGNFPFFRMGCAPFSNNFGLRGGKESPLKTVPSENSVGYALAVLETAEFLKSLLFLDRKGEFGIHGRF